MFTTQAGCARHPVCSGAVMTERSLFYPVVFVVKKIGTSKLTVEGREHDYAYVIAKYGLRMFIRQDHLTNMDSPKAYIFTNGVVPTKICRNATSSSDPDAVYLDAEQSYAVVDRSKLFDSRDHENCNW